MDNLASSTPNKTICDPSESRCDSLEESGWTQYIDGFSAYGDNPEEEEEIVSMGSGYAGASSMVTDAGSGPEWKEKLLHGLPRFPKRLNFKSKRTQEISNDDSLEDTASSPVNSPKITMNFKRMDLNSRQMGDGHDNYMVEGSISIDRHTKDKYKNPRQDACVESVEFTTLKDKGLCLVPISMVISHFH